jgi:N-dimethylarginine dimethylaminohydrolase
MLEFDDSCIVHRRAFSPESIRLLKKFLGHDKVYVIDSTDDFCINAIVDGPNLITHHMTESLKQKIEKITGRHIKMIDASEFEQSGGSVRCMVLDIRT